MKSKRGMIYLSALITLLILGWFMFFTNSVVVKNTSKSGFSDVIIFKPRVDVDDVILWKGKIPANSCRLLFIPSGHSDDSVVVHGKLDENEISKEEIYYALSPFGPTRFHFTIFQNMQIESQVKFWFNAC